MLTFSVLDCKYPFFGKFGPKTQYCQLKLQFGTWTNLNMQNSIVMLNFSAWDKKYPFWSKFGPKKTKLSVLPEI